MTRLASALVLRVAEGEQQGDGQRFGSGRERAYRRDHPPDLVLAERLEHPVGTGALGDRHDVGPRDERRRVVAGEVVQRRPVLAPQPKEVFEALRRHERDAGTAALEEGVGSDRGSVNQDIDRDRGQGVQCSKQPDRGIVRRGHDLPDLNRPVFREGDEIGEGSPHIHAHPHHPATPVPAPVRNAECGMRNR